MSVSSTFFPVCSIAVLRGVTTVHNNTDNRRNLLLQTVNMYRHSMFTQCYKTYCVRGAHSLYVHKSVSSVFLTLVSIATQSYLFGT